MLSADAVSGLELLATAVFLIDEELKVVYANPASEHLFAQSRKNLVGQSAQQIFEHNELLFAALRYADIHDCTYIEHDLELALVGRPAIHLSCSMTPAQIARYRYLLLEFQPIDQQLKVEREARLLEQGQATRELIRNLAHEVRNPLGGIKGAAQLLSRELKQPHLHEYTHVIMKEADRLQSLTDRLLTPHRVPELKPTNIHEILEHVQSIVVAETVNSDIQIVRDYDTSLPLVVVDKEQMIQAFLNIVRNAAQAIQNQGAITLRTRVVRQVTLARVRYRHALMVQVIDNGPGIPDSIRDKVFLPLVSHREGGSGLGLSLAQTFINHHHGTIEFESVPGNTRFTILLPFPQNTTD